MTNENDIKTYLNMQHMRYQERASTAIMTKNGVMPQSDGVVGSYTLQEQFPYDANILKHFKKDPKKSAVLEYGCGPGRNLLRLAPKFGKVAGVDISELNIRNASIALNNLNGYSASLHTTTGDNIPLEDNLFDLIFEVICLQHICSYTIRKRILTDMVRVCKPEGQIVCQFGYNKAMRNDPGTRYHVEYYVDSLIGIPDTNGASDCCVTDEKQLLKDFEDLGLKVIEIWHTSWVMDMNHDDWIWICGEKPV